MEKINKFYNLSQDIVEKIKEEKHVKIRDNLYIDKNIKFIWPNLNNDYYNETGYCYALKDQIAILVDGTVVPCCLDSDGIIKLGNIYKDNFETIINSNRVKKIKEGFCNRKVTEELCKHCNFKDRLLTNK